MSSQNREPSLALDQHAPEQNNFGLSVPGKLTRTGWELPASLSREDWAKCGGALTRIEGSVQWWLGDWWAFGSARKYGDGEEVAEAVGVNYGTIRVYGSVASAYELLMRNNNLPFDHHRIAMSAEPAERADVLHEAERRGWSVRELKSEISRRRTKSRLLLPSGDDETCTVSDLFRIVESGKRFSTIYADPPWKYDNQGTRASTDTHYDGLTVEELCSLPVKDLSAEDAHLHLWTTNGFLFECPKIFKAWGFEFKSSFIWTKPTIGIGNYWRNSHEFLLTAIRGDAKRFNDHTIRSWFECARGEHSAKPEQVRSYIERASAGPRIELFGRREVANWVVWGNDIRRELFDRTVEAA